MPQVPLLEEIYDAKEDDKKLIHFNGSCENIELLLRIVISANQFSVYRAIADLCDEVPTRVRAPGKPAARDRHLEKMVIPADLCKLHQILTNATAVEKPTAIIRAKNRAIVRRPEVIQIVF